MLQIQVKQRSDYTFKHNAGIGRHGWLRLTPAYSVKIVNEILDYFDKDKAKIIDPFSGSATTALCAAEHGFDAATVEINTFLQWFGRVKTAIFSQEDIVSARHQMEHAVNDVRNGKGYSEPPPIYKIEKWWDSSSLKFLCNLKGAINNNFTLSSKSKDLALIAFCRTMIRMSNASFNHQSMSFKKSRQIDLFGNSDQSQVYEEGFRKDWEFVFETALLNPQKESKVIPGNALFLDKVIKDKFDLLITSPPYPNRMSYIRELRPYMYWLGYLKEAKEAGELDWEAIGGTWGIATSRLMDWKRSKNSFVTKYFEDILDKIAHSDNKNGILMANYVAKYFEDIWTHLKAVSKIMVLGGKVHYIVGNSTFYKVLLPTEKIYSDMLSSLGFEDVTIRTVRKRNSKKELFEFDVSATWN